MGDRVIPIDKAWLWRDPNVVLMVTKCDYCQAPTYRGEEIIELWVQWLGKDGFRVRQFAEDYQKWVKPDIQPSIAWSLR